MFLAVESISRSLSVEKTGQLTLKCRIVGLFELLLFDRKWFDRVMKEETGFEVQFFFLVQLISFESSMPRNLQSLRFARR